MREKASVMLHKHSSQLRISYIKDSYQYRYGTYITKYSWQVFLSLCLGVTKEKQNIIIII